MNEQNDPNVQILENATPFEVDPGDYIIWEGKRDVNGVTVYERREGVAAYHDAFGDWKNENGAWITEGYWNGTTLTIRRPLTKEG